MSPMKWSLFILMMFSFNMLLAMILNTTIISVNSPNKLKSNNLKWKFSW
nr:ATP synthase F0 subunit 8 [Melecta chinensis]WFP44653.1 ATP synthase F0 subunit 8 [Melecta chinensis]